MRKFLKEAQNLVFEVESENLSLEEIDSSRFKFIKGLFFVCPNVEKIVCKVEDKNKVSVQFHPIKNKKIHPFEFVILTADRYFVSKVIPLNQKEKTITLQRKDFIIEDSQFEITLNPKIDEKIVLFIEQACSLNGNNKFNIVNELMKELFNCSPCLNQVRFGLNGVLINDIVIQQFMDEDEYVKSCLFEQEFPLNEFDLIMNVISFLDLYGYTLAWTFKREIINKLF